MLRPLILQDKREKKHLLQVLNFILTPPFDGKRIEMRLDQFFAHIPILDAQQDATTVNPYLSVIGILQTNCTREEEDLLSRALMPFWLYVPSFDVINISPMRALRN